MSNGKLVRDKIPEIIAASGVTPKTRILDAGEYRKELDRKLLEEAGDLLETLKARLALDGLTLEDAENARATKCEVARPPFFGHEILSC